jgi:hypothetical protein
MGERINFMHSEVFDLLHIVHTMQHSILPIAAADLEDFVGFSITIRGTAHDLSHVNEGGQGFTAVLVDVEGNLINIFMHVVCGTNPYLNVVLHVLCIPGVGYEKLDQA